MSDDTDLDSSNVDVVEGYNLQYYKHLSGEKGTLKASNKRKRLSVISTPAKAVENVPAAAASLGVSFD
jgi:hypothetical protein